MSRPSAFDGYLGAILGAVSLAVPGCDDPLKLDWSCHLVSVDEASIELEKRWGLDLDEVLARLTVRYLVWENLYYVEAAECLPPVETELRLELSAGASVEICWGTTLAEAKLSARCSLMGLTAEQECWLWIRGSADVPRSMMLVSTGSYRFAIASSLERGGLGPHGYSGPQTEERYFSGAPDFLCDEESYACCSPSAMETPRP